MGLGAQGVASVIAVVGILVVIGAVLGGYLEEGGKIGVLVQPAEFIVIGGAALGSMLVGTPVKTLKALGKQLAGITKTGPSSKDYLDLLLMLYELLNLTRREGLLAARAPSRGRR